MKANEFITEKWSQKYKSSINCSHPKGFSQKAHCAGKKKHNEDVVMEMVCPDCGMCQTHGNLNEIKKGQKDSNGYTKCWPGKHAEGTKKGKNGGQVRNCVPNESMAEGTYNKDVERAFPGGKAPGVKTGASAPKGTSTMPKDKEKAKGKPISENAEYDDEAGMADNNLETLRRAVDGIDSIIKPGDNLPEWCQEKIAVAKSMLVTVWDYMESEKDRGALDESQDMCHVCGQTPCNCTHLTEEFDLIESIVESIAVRNNVDSELVWEDLESLSDDELYVFAVTSEPINEDWQKVNKKDKTDGMSKKAVNAYRREHPGSKLKTAVTTKPSKLKKGSKASKRRKSYCSRSRGQMKMHNISCAKTPDKAICKARRRWNC